jgi:hypothetical protein
VAAFRRHRERLRSLSFTDHLQQGMPAGGGDIVAQSAARNTFERKIYIFTRGNASKSGAIVNYSKIVFAIVRRRCLKYFLCQHTGVHV